MDGIATLRTRIEKRKSGKEWRVDYFICSIKNSNRGNCKNKQIRADYIEEEVKRQLKIEIQRIEYSKEELKKIYRNAQNDTKKTIDNLEKDLKRSKGKLDFINKALQEIYEDKVKKVITQEDFEKFYNQKNIEKANIINKIEELENEIKHQKASMENVDIDKILKQTNEVLSLKNITGEMYAKLIEKIEFDSNKNLYIKFKFKKQ